MKERNWGEIRNVVRSRDGGTAYLQNGVLLLNLELVGAKKLETAVGLFCGETILVALEELEDVVDDDGLEVDLFLIVQVLRLELDLSYYELRVFFLPAAIRTVPMSTRASAADGQRSRYIKEKEKLTGGTLLLMTEILVLALPFFWFLRGSLLRTRLFLDVVAHAG